MGFLEVGTPLSWEESEPVREYVKRHGLKQFLHRWLENKDRIDGDLRWGEEVEYSLVDIDSDNSVSRIFVNAHQVIEELELREHIRPRVSTQLSSDWHPEFSNHMVEAIPSPPYTLDVNSLRIVEPSMWLRRIKIQAALPEGKYVTSLTAFPRFGLPDTLTPESVADPDNSITRSVFVPDEVINPHPRFGTLVNNIRSRRRAKPFITIPVYEDTRTYSSEGSSPENNWTLARRASELDRFEVEELARRTMNPVKGHIYMDCFAFGMGMSCVQTTFAASNISAARYLYDQLAVLAPLFLALTASTPVLRGLLADTDTRWSTLEQAVDCRTEEEMKTVPKSRYSGISLYISDRPSLRERIAQLNDTNPPINETARQQLMSEGVDDILANHYGHLWVRDPMVIFAEKVKLDDCKAADHFENIQSTNWNSIRFKPPPPPAVDSVPGTPSPIGWRVEFRSPEIQLTDLDNAAGVALMSVLAQMIMAQDLDLYIPMSQNDENMHRSWQRDAVTRQKFFFRSDISCGTTNFMTSEMTLLEILTGGGGFKGLVPLCEEFLAGEQAAGRVDAETRLQFAQFCDLMTKRAAGQLMTTAQFLRRFVLEHPCYRQDSVVNSVINHDLTVLSTNLGFGVLASPDLHGDLPLPVVPLPASTALPRFSRWVKPPFVTFDSQKDPRTLPVPAIRLVERSRVDLFDIDGIERMPVGGLGSCPLTYGDLLSHCCGLLKHSKSARHPLGALNSEDFRSAWMEKSFDFVGRGPTVDSEECTSASSQFVGPCSCSTDQGGSNSPRSLGACQCGGLREKLLRGASPLEGAQSTICPSSNTEDGINYEVGNELVHELVRGSGGLDDDE